MKLYGTSGSRALRSIWAAEETGVDYELVPTDWKLRHQFALLLYERGSIMAAEAELAESLRLWEAAGGEEAGPRPSLPAPVAGPTRPTGS